MAKYTYSQNNFISGELDPRLEGRNDLKEYNQGAALMENWLPIKTGGVTTRPATNYCTTHLDPSDFTVWATSTGYVVDDLVKFEANPNDGYEIYRCISNHTSLVFATDLGNSLWETYIDSSTGTDTFSQHTYPIVFNEVESYLVVISNHPTAASAWKIYKKDGATYLLLFSSSTVTVDASTPDLSPSGLNVDVADFNFHQIGGILFLCHKSRTVPPILVRRTSDDNFTVESYWNWCLSSMLTTASPNSIRSVPFKKRNTSAIGLTYTIPGAHVITATNALFTAGHVGSYLRIQDASDREIVFKITVFTSNLIVEGVPQAGACTTGAAYLTWALSAWSDEDGWPGVVTSYQSRVVFGGTLSQPDTLWFSAANNLKLMLNYKLTQDITPVTFGASDWDDISNIDYYGAVTDADAFDILLSGGNISTINWAVSNSILQVGTNIGEHSISNVDGFFGPNNYRSVQSTNYGGAGRQPINIQNAIVFITRDRESLRELSYSEENGANTSRLLSILSSEMVAHNSSPADNLGFRQIVYQASEGIIWALTDSDELVSLTIERSSNVLAWAKHTLASGSNGMVIKSLAILPDSNGKDSLIIQTKRFLDVQFKFDIEVIDSNGSLDSLFPLTGYTYKRGHINLDYAQLTVGQTEGANTADANNNSVGETVAVFYKGLYQGTEVVKLGGSVNYIDIDQSSYNAGEIYIGYPYICDINSMAIEAGSKTGDSQIQVGRIDTLYLRIFRGFRFKVGTDVNNLEEEVLQDASNPLNLYTGDKRVSVAGTSNEIQRFYIRVDQPYPMTLLSVGVRGQIQD